MDLGLQGKRAVITGGASGIGLACCHALAKQGVALYVADLNVSATEEAVASLRCYGTTVAGGAVDVSSSTSVQSMVADAIQTLGGIDLLVNSAGIVSICRLLELPEADFDRIMDINTKGVFLCSQAVMKHMIKQGTKGKVVNISSQAAKKPVNFEGHYSVSKAAVNMLTQCFAMEGAPHSINVNAVCPGSIASPLNSRITDERAALTGISPEQFLARTLKDTPLGRQGTVEEIAQMTVLLCSSWTDFMTGQAVNLTGGRVLW